MSHGVDPPVVKNNGGVLLFNIERIYLTCLCIFSLVISFHVLTMDSRTTSDNELNDYTTVWEQQGGAVPQRRGHYQFRRIQFRERQARRYGIRRTSYHITRRKSTRRISGRTR